MPQPDRRYLRHQQPQTPIPTQTDSFSEQTPPPEPPCPPPPPSTASATPSPPRWPCPDMERRRPSKSRPEDRLRRFGSRMTTSPPSSTSSAASGTKPRTAPSSSATTGSPSPMPTAPTLSAQPSRPPPFRLRQSFLGGLRHERAMLAMLAEDLARFEAVVTYNGRAFDVPIVESRLTMARLPSPYRSMAHFDLLHPVRRLYAHRMPGCRLAEAERRLLRLDRPDDVPGYLIPPLYRDYPLAGRARPPRG